MSVGSIFQVLERAAPGSGAAHCAVPAGPHPGSVRAGDQGMPRSRRRAALQYSGFKSIPM